MKIFGEKFTEFISFIVCVVIILAVAYATGVLKGFSLYDIKMAYINISNELFNKSQISEVQNYVNTQRASRRSSVKYKKYVPHIIPDSVLDGSESAGVMRNVFNSGRKVVFYIYNDSSDIFHNAIYNTINSKEIKGIYTLAAYSQQSFSSIRTGAIGPSKICDSLQECNIVRKKAADYSTLMNFMQQCGKTMCIFNPRKGQYFKIETRKSSEAINALQELKNW